MVPTPFRCFLLDPQLELSSIIAVEEVPNSPHFVVLARKIAEIPLPLLLSLHHCIRLNMHKQVHCICHVVVHLCHTVATVLESVFALARRLVRGPEGDVALWPEVRLAQVLRKQADDIERTLRIRVLWHGTHLVEICRVPWRKIAHVTIRRPVFQLQQLPDSIFALHTSLKVVGEELAHLHASHLTDITAPDDRQRVSLLSCLAWTRFARHAPQHPRRPRHSADAPAHEDGLTLHPSFVKGGKHLRISTLDELRSILDAIGGA